MVTVGWVIITNSDQSVFDSCHFSNLPFVRMSDEPLKITIPLVTPFEVREMERKLPNIEASLELNWIPQPERRSFCAIYRYLPQFSVVEQI